MYQSTLQANEMERRGGKRRGRGFPFHVLISPTSLLALLSQRSKTGWRGLPSQTRSGRSYGQSPNWMRRSFCAKELPSEICCCKLGTRCIRARSGLTTKPTTRGIDMEIRGTTPCYGACGFNKEIIIAEAKRGISLAYIIRDYQH